MVLNCLSRSLSTWLKGSKGGNEIAQELKHWSFYGSCYSFGVECVVCTVGVINIVSYIGTVGRVLFYGALS